MKFEDKTLWLREPKENRAETGIPNIPDIKIISTFKHDNGARQSWTTCGDRNKDLKAQLIGTIIAIRNNSTLRLGTAKYISLLHKYETETLFYLLFVQS
jgi:hypothetical protein